MTREQKMLAVAVAAAARQVVECDGKGFSMGELRQALAALDALPAQPQPQGETVAWVAWEGDNGEAVLCRAGSILDTPERGWTRLGTVTLPLDRDGGE